MSIKIKLRRDTEANWTSFNPVLAVGEPGVELEQGRIKIGNGVDAWNDLPYAAGATGPAGADGATGAQGAQGPAGADGVDGADGVGVPTGGTTGQVLSKIDGVDYNTQWSDPVVAINDLSDIVITTPTSGQVIKYDGTNWINSTDVSGGGGIALTDLSAVVDPAGVTNFTYNNTTGVFTYTPPDLSGYLTAETDPVFTASPAAGVTAQNITDWSTAFGWGDHAAAGYLTSTISGSITPDTDASYSLGGPSNKWSQVHATTLYGSNTVTPQITGVTTLGLSSGSDFTVSSNANITLNATSGSVFFNSPTIDFGTPTTVTGLALTDLGVTDGTNGQVLTTDGAGNFTFTTVGGASSNLDGLTDVTITTPTSGQVLKYNGSAWVNDTDATSGGSTTFADLTDTFISSPSFGDILTYNGSAWTNGVSNFIELADLSVGAPAAASGSGGIAYDALTGVFTYTPPDILNSFSVTQNAASGTGTLAYNNLTGAFTYTPPDLSSFITSEANDLTTAVTWANVPDANITQTSVTQHEAALSINESQITFTSSFIELIDLSATTVAASGNGSLSYSNATGVFTYTPPDLSGYLTSFTELDPVVGAVNGIVKADGAGTIEAAVAGTDYVAPFTLTTTNGTTASIADGATENLNLTGGQVYTLYKIETSAAAWVRVYSTDAARTADSGRTQGVDPTANSGVIAEAITTGAETVVFTPAVNGFNDEAVPTSAMPIAVTNNSGGAAAITVTITKMTLIA